MCVHTKNTENSGVTVHKNPFKKLKKKTHCQFCVLTISDS